jgi:hypothetical protein
VDPSDFDADPDLMDPDFQRRMPDPDPDADPDNKFMYMTMAFFPTFSIVGIEPHTTFF